MRRSTDARWGLAFPADGTARAGFAAQLAEERAAVDLMLWTLCAGYDVPDLMDGVLEEPPNGDVDLKRIYIFQGAAAHIALQNSATPELPTGAPSPFLDAMHNSFDAGLYPLNAATAFSAARNA